MVFSQWNLTLVAGPLKIKMIKLFKLTYSETFEDMYCSGPGE